MVFDNESGQFVTMIPDGPSNPSYIHNGGVALIVYALQDKDISMTSALCVSHDLNSGVNFLGISCTGAGTTANQLLMDLGEENATSIQRFNSVTGRFETVGFDENGSPVGRDFTIAPGEGYFLHMRQQVDGHVF